MPHADDIAEREGAAASGTTLREQILADPAGKGAYERAREEIERHQASLAKVRKLRALAQATVAEAMGMDQSEISRLERRSDLLLSTLRRFVNATGGDLHLVASYPDGDVELLVGPPEPVEPAEQPLPDA
ncbi:MAG: XRE family transcriptional regulator [Candidatus Dormibacteria bacterium]